MFNGVSNSINNTMQYVAGSLGSAQIIISGLEIIVEPGDTWAGIRAAAMTTEDGTNHMPTTLVAAGAGKDFTSIVAGEYTSNTTYTGSINLKDPFHDWARVGTDDGSTHYTGNSYTGSYFIKFSEPIALHTVHLAFFRSSNIYWWNSVVFKDQDGNVLTPVTAPADASDENGDIVVDGASAENTAWNDLYKWVFV